jgi:hypothetical protein
MSKATKVWKLVEVVEPLRDKYKTLSSNPGTTSNKKNTNTPQEIVLCNRG